MDLRQPQIKLLPEVLAKRIPWTVVSAHLLLSSACKQLQALLQLYCQMRLHLKLGLLTSYGTEILLVQK